jgi:myo-inositol-1(or 4)-monophosphatase
MSDEVQIAEIAAKKAGEIIRSLLGRVQIIEKGRNYNLVTEADTNAEKCIIEVIRNHYPEDALLGEESCASTKLD